MQHGLVIDALGGPTAVARLLGCHYSRPVRWRTEGIPRRRWPEIVAAARSLGKRVTLDALMAGEPKPAERAGA